MSSAFRRSEGRAFRGYNKNCDPGLDDNEQREGEGQRQPLPTKDYISRRHPSKVRDEETESARSISPPSFLKSGVDPPPLRGNSYSEKFLRRDPSPLPLWRQSLPQTTRKEYSISKSYPPFNYPLKQHSPEQRNSSVTGAGAGAGAVAGAGAPLPLWRQELTNVTVTAISLPSNSKFTNGMENTDSSSHHVQDDNRINQGTQAQQRNPVRDSWHQERSLTRTSSQHSKFSGGFDLTSNSSHPSRDPSFRQEKNEEEGTEPQDFAAPPPPDPPIPVWHRKQQSSSKLPDPQSMALQEHQSYGQRSGSLLPVEEQKALLKDDPDGAVMKKKRHRVVRSLSCDTALMDDTTHSFDGDQGWCDEYEDDDHDWDFLVKKESRDRNDMYHGTRDRNRQSTLSENTFSFLIAAPVWSYPFWTGVFVFLLKAIIYSLILANMIEFGAPDNPLGISSAVEWPVAVCQIIVMAINVITQDDLITALQDIHTGHTQVGSAFKHATYSKWLTSVWTLFSLGALGLVVSFLLIITTSDVMDLILNFTAIEFISLLDNIVFQLAASGFFGKANKTITMLIQETHYTADPDKHLQTPWFQITLLLTSFLGMLGGLGVVFFLQINGSFLPQHFILQFDDEVTPYLSTFSDMFDLHVNYGRSSLESNRIVYRSKTGGSVGYCDKLKAWTVGESRSNYCEGVMAISSNPTNRDISRVFGKPWFVRMNGNERMLPMGKFFFEKGCATDLECGGTERGKCIHQMCHCNDDFFGLRCNYVYTDVCETIRVNEQTGAFYGLRRTVAIEYNLLRDDTNATIVQAYHHPVYIESGWENKNPGEAVDVVLYAGLRWILTSVVPDPEKGLKGRFDNSFHIDRKSIGTIEATTELVHFDTATDERPSPTKMKWYLPGSQKIENIDPVLSINTVFICSKCGDDNPCSFGNTCAEDGKCICLNGERGSLCQVIPVGDGRCDPFFNKEEFDMDGGDCCEASCMSSDLYQCGVDSSESGIDGTPVGFSLCEDPEYAQCNSGKFDCWNPKSSHIPLLIEKSSGAFVRLSSNGRTIVVSEPEMDTIRIFDQEDSRWIQRGQTLEGQARSRFGTHVVINTLPGNVIRRRSGKTPVIVAVAATGANLNYVEVYRFEPHATIWEKIGQRLMFDDDIEDVSFGSSISGMRLGVGLVTSKMLVYAVKELLWKILWKTHGSCVGLSGDGKMIATTSILPYEGTGIYDLSNVELIKSPDQELVNLLPSGAYKFAFQSRPATMRLSYTGNFGTAIGQMVKGTYGISGIGLLGLTGVPGSGVSYMVDRIGEVGVDTVENSQVQLAISADTLSFGVNSQRTLVDVYDFAPKKFGTGQIYHPNTSSIPLLEVSGYQSKFDIADGGKVMAFIDDDRVSIVQRNSTCKNQTAIRIAITLDEQPGSVSWSFDCVGKHKGIYYPTENIVSCDHCYGGDDRYTRVVVVEDFCIPEDLVGCMQLTFMTDRDLSDGAGFVAMKDGSMFASYQPGKKEAKVIAPGSCKFSCETDERALAMVMNFANGQFPTMVSLSDQPSMWSSSIDKLPGISGPILIQRCLKAKSEMEKLTVYRVDNGGADDSSDGNYVVYLDDVQFALQTFDIGARQVLDIPLNSTVSSLTSIPAKCNIAVDGSNSLGGCDACRVCPKGMAVNVGGKWVDRIGDFESVKCAVLESLGVNGRLNNDFCDLLPGDIETQCDCREETCDVGEVPLIVKIEFDKFPGDLTFIVSDENGAVVWFQDFQGFASSALSPQAEGVDSISTFGQCVPSTGALHFEINDSKGDGLCCTTESNFFVPRGSRRYEVYLDDELVGRRLFPFGSHQEMLLRAGEASSPVEIYQMPVWCSDCPPCDVCPGNQAFNRNESITFDLYGTINCNDYLVNMSYYIGSEFCSANQGHIMSSCGCTDFNFECSSLDESVVRFEMVFDDESVGGKDVVVEVRDEWNKTLWSKVGFASDSSGRFEACIPSQRRIRFAIENQDSSFSFGVLGSFSIFVENNKFIEGIIPLGERYEVVYGEEFINSPVDVGLSTAFYPTNNSTGVAGGVSSGTGPHPLCNICGEGNTITIGNATVTIPGETVQPTCTEFDEAAWTGHVSAELCPLVVGIVTPVCGCVPETSLNTSTAPTTSPSSTTRHVPEPGPHPQCHVCGNAYDITLFDPVVFIPEQNATSTCGEFRDNGLNGHISAELCPWMSLALGSICGCTAVGEPSEVTPPPVDDPVAR